MLYGSDLVKNARFLSLISASGFLGTESSLALIMQKEIFMLSCQKLWNTPGISGIEKARFHFLNLCFVRFVVEKHGGTMETDPATYTAYIRIPQNKRAVCTHAVEKHMNTISHRMCALIAALSSGTVLIQPGKN